MNQKFKREKYSQINCISLLRCSSITLLNYGKISPSSKIHQSWLTCWSVFINFTKIKYGKIPLLPVAVTFYCLSNPSLWVNHNHTYLTKWVWQLNNQLSRKLPELQVRCDCHKRSVQNDNPTLLRYVLANPWDGYVLNRWSWSVKTRPIGSQPVRRVQIVTM